jgi:NTP pyrophosphatase (non-canonical NTP hydrolase)
MAEHFNGLSPQAAEMFALLIEECGEVIQVCGKILRHGYTSHHPVSGATNSELLHKELGDVLAAVELLERDYYVSMPEIRARKRDKLGRVGKYLHHVRLAQETPVECPECGSNDPKHPTPCSVGPDARPAP